MESIKKAGLSKVTNVGEELAKESTSSQTPRVIRSPASLQESELRFLHNWEPSKV